jgi:hypothetical protein
MIYIGKFLHATNQQESDATERRHGEFNLIIEAEGKDIAIEKFRERITEFRKSTELFEGDSFIYFVHMVELDEFPAKNAKMLYYKSIAGDPVMPFISCSNPTADAEGCRIYNWQESRPEIDGQDANVFLQFTD